jgi:Domain of unknown function (DUF1707)
MSEPGGGAPAGRRSLLGDADRERLIMLPREHYAAGRLGLDDLRHRVGGVLTAAYAEEAAVALADLTPAGVPGTPAAGRGGNTRGRHAQARRPEPGWVSRRPSTGGSARSDARRTRRASDRAQVRADAARAIVRYQEPPARFSAPRTRKKAAHP